MTSLNANTSLPVIDMAPLFTAEKGARAEVAEAIQQACRTYGFFYVIGHRVSLERLEALDSASRRFFALSENIKMKIGMAQGGLAWRGFFPVGGELTSGKPDIKEGLYFGSELSSEHPRVAAGWPLHGANLWPEEVPELKNAVTGYMASVAKAAAVLLEGIALSLDLEADYFAANYTADPTVLFRIFHYPPPAEEAAGGSWGVGEHTDYGLLTLLAQDRHGGLQVKTPDGWINAPPIEGTLVCNIGDMLDRLTGGWFRSTPHRVQNVSGSDRLSFPLFFDPDFAAEMKPLPEQASRSASVGEARWDGADLQAFEGTYGDYLISKVSKVFPELSGKVL